MKDWQEAGMKDNIIGAEAYSALVWHGRLKHFAVLPAHPRGLRRLAAYEAPGLPIRVIPNMPYLAVCGIRATKWILQFGTSEQRADQRFRDD